MAGLGEILEENARLREREAHLAAQIALLTQQVEALTISNERFAKHFEFLEKRREMAATERLVASEAQRGLFEGREVAAPPRDPELEKEQESKSGTEKPDKRRTPTHTPKGRRDLSKLELPRQVVVAP